jgi:hypothetical protein
MLEFFESMDSMQKIFWFTALPASFIFAIQTIMTFSGLDASDGVEADFEGDLEGADAPFQLFSFRNLINFLLGFGWGGVSFFHTIENRSLLTLTALLIGISFVWLFFLIMRQIQGLAEDNTFAVANAVNQTGQVYLGIPPNKSGKGKVLVSAKGATHELEAMTTAFEKLETGAMIRVVSVENNILIVEKI